jgi:hypothetical protein
MPSRSRDAYYETVDIRDRLMACPIGEALWLEYRKRNPFGRQFPPTASEDCKRPGTGPVLRPHSHLRGLQ